MASLSAEQKDVIRSVVRDVRSGEEQVLTIGGHAGVGKSLCVRVLSEVLENFAVCAFTGKAANVLRQRGVHSASTIHSAIYKPYTREDGKVEFVLKAKFELGCGGFLVDEASMVSRDVFGDLLSFGLPVVFVGDHGQLEPVGDDVYVMKDPKYRLETIHRNAGEIAYFAEHLRKGGLVHTFQGDKKVRVISQQDVTDQLLTSVDQSICAFNRFRVGQNRHVRSLLGHDGLVALGERVICLRNNRLEGLFNGMQGVVSATYEDENRFDFESDGILYERIKYVPEQFGKERNETKYGKDTPHPFDYAYFVTCHKSQGSSWGNVLVFEQVCDKWDHRRWIYTAVTRAENWVCVVADRPMYVPSWL